MGIFDTASLFDAIPFATILFVFLALIYWVNAFFIVYHLIRFGVGARPKVISLIFFIGSGILFSIALSWFLVIDVSFLGDMLTGNIEDLIQVQDPYTY